MPHSTTRALKRQLAAVLPWAALVALAIRLFQRTHSFEVNLLFWDELDYRSGFFSNADLWSLFAWQHGPHRMGLGNLLGLALYKATDWDSRSEAFASVAVIVLAAAICMLVVQRILARRSWWDALIPLALISGLHADALAGAANSAHGPLPLLLLMALVATQLVKPLLPRLLLILVIDFLSIFTGFALVICVLVRVLLLWDLAGAWRKPAQRNAYLVSLCLSAVAPWLFLRGYVFGAAVDCFFFPYPRPLEYAPFIGLLFTRPFGISGVGTWRIPFVLGASIAVLAALLSSMRHLLRSRLAAASDAVPRTVFLLVGYSVVFAATTAVGRVCLGTEAAASARYVAYVLPALVGLYVATDAWLPEPWRHAGLTLLLVAFVAKETLVTLRPIRETQWLVAGKRAWKECYLRRRDVQGCDRETGFQIYPAPERTHLQAKLDYLAARRLNLFR